MSAFLEEEGWKKKSLGGFMDRLGPIWVKAVEQGWNVGLEVTQDHVNPLGVMHGGVALTLFDHALSLAAWKANEKRPCYTVQLDTHFVGITKVGDMVLCRPTSVRRSGRLAFVGGTMVVQDREVAVANGVWSITQKS